MTDFFFHLDLRNTSNDHTRGISYQINVHAINRRVFQTMHALGVYHEHTRPDRDQYIKIHMENVPESNYHDFAIKTTDEIQLLRDRFDFWSIMMYGPKAFSKNNKNTMSSKIKGRRLITENEKKSMSDGDVEVLRKLYKCDEKSNEV